MPVTITAERPDTPEALRLIDELQTHLESFYPPESRHGFSGFRRIPPFGPYTDDPLSRCDEKSIGPDRKSHTPA